MPPRATTGYAPSFELRDWSASRDEELDLDVIDDDSVGQGKTFTGVEDDSEG